MLPLTFAYDALRGVADNAGVSNAVAFDLTVTVLMSVASLALGSLTMKRQTQ